MSKFADLDTAALAALFAEKSQALAALIEAAGDNPTPEHVTEGEALAAERDEIKAEQSAREALAAETAEKFAALKNSFSEGDVEDEPTQEEKDAAEAEAKAAEEAAAEEAAAEAAAVAAATKPAAKVTAAVRRVAKKTERPAVPSNEPVSIVASSNVPGFSSGDSLNGIEDVAKAVVAKMKGFTPPGGDGKTENLQKFGVASIAMSFDESLQINRGTDDMEVLYRASNESRLEGNSLVAAGGWCAPSETLYDLAADESVEGILSLPEVQVNRGGIRYTRGPQFADFYAEAGFIQTEAQAIAGTTKPCYEVDCPTFTDVRLDAVGLCIKVPILTNAAYPELVQRFTSGTLIAHQHMVNANVISRMVAIAGAARVFADSGSTVSDSLEALELVADQRRQQYRLSLTRSMEVVVPFWTKAVMRNDLARRQGVGSEAISDADIMAHFAARNLMVSFVYDWQVLDQTVEVYPATYQALVYPAGTFVKGVSDVINLSAVYDAASLSVNTYTGLFMEQGLLVASMQYGADLVTLPICSMGRVGAADLTCAP